MSNELRTLLKSRLLTCYILWFAIAFSVSILFFVVTLKNKVERFDFDALKELYLAPESLPILIVALVTFSLSFYIPKFLKSKKSRPGNPSELLAEFENARNEQGKPLYSPKDIQIFKNLPLSELEIFSNFNKKFTAFIVSMALTEACGVFGFLIANINSNQWAMLPLLALAYVGFIAHFPKLETFANS